MSMIGFALPQFVARVLEWLRQAADWFAALGPLGVMLLAFADSFIPMAGGPDFVVVILAARQPLLAPVVVVAATVGATIGATLVYLGARRAGAAALSRFGPERRERVETLLGRYDMLTIMVAVMLPPPFPFKIFNLGAGVFRVPIARFVAAILAGRAMRFSLEAFLAVRYGEQAMKIIERHGLVILAVVAVLGVAFWLWRTFAARRGRAAGDDTPVPTE
jgi:membrane protein YqaA with SNARE-associated domain